MTRIKSLLRRLDGGWLIIAACAALALGTQSLGIVAALVVLVAALLTVDHVTERIEQISTGRSAQRARVSKTANSRAKRAAAGVYGRSMAPAAKRSRRS